MKVKFEFFLIAFVVSLNASFFESTINDNHNPAIYTWIVSKMSEKKQLTRLMNMHPVIFPLVNAVVTIPFSLCVSNKLFSKNTRGEKSVCFVLLTIITAGLGHILDKGLKLKASKRLAVLHSSESKNEC